MKDITVGADGNLWYTFSDALGRMTPTGAFRLFHVPTNSGINGICKGPDGNAWFTEENSKRSGG